MRRAVISRVVLSPKPKWMQVTRASSQQPLSSNPMRWNSPPCCSFHPRAGFRTVRCHSSSSMENAQTIEEVLAAVEEQAMEDERRRAIENPTPWFSLLHYPSRAAWRSTDHVFGSTTGGKADEIDAPSSPLSQTQFNLLQHSGRTNKQLKRTYKRIVDTHKLLALRRERERRLAANLSNHNKQTESGGGRPDGSIKDGEGQHVGSWRERKKKLSAPAFLCDDPSVALALSMGLSNSKIDANDEMLLDAMSVKSAKGAHKLSKSKDVSSISSKEKPVGYGAEQAMTNVKYRLGPNYSIVRRVLLEVQSLLGGKPPEGSNRKSFRPKRVLDFGCGVGSSSAASLDVFGVSRSAGGDDNSFMSGTVGATNGIDWIHSIDASQCMRETSEKILKSILECAPWDSEQTQMEEDALDEELAEYERVIRQIRGDAVDGKKLQRQQKRMQKWERQWEKQSNYRTRLTFGESIVDVSSFYSNKIYRDDRPSLPWQQRLDEQRRRTIQKKAQTTNQQKGSFDLILCAYTLSELPNVSSSLTAAALLWEKLAPNGVMVFVEPGTPDGFSTLRSVRSMLLECCPPPEIREGRRRAAMQNAQTGEGDVDGEGAINSSDNDYGWPEECHVIAPCTHNGTCPMSRHQRDHVKRNTRFGKYEGAAEPESEEDEIEEGGSREQKRVESSQGGGMLDDWEDMNEEEREQLKMMVGAEDMSDEDMLEMMKYIEENVDGDDDYDDDDEEESSDDEKEDLGTDDNEFFDIDGESSDPSPKSTMRQTDVFDTSFCSFVHNFPGGTSRKRGEKFSYLVLQKRVRNDSVDSEESEEKQREAIDIDAVDMLSKSVYHAQELKEEDLQKRKEKKDFDRRGYGEETEFHKTYFHNTYDTYHKEQSHRILQESVKLEDEYLDSTIDSLGLELLIGDERRRGWGRLIRAPLKRKGHVLLDYCSAGCGGTNGCFKGDGDGDSNNLPDETKGRITRQKVSRGWSARAAPGCHAAARKARWGGLWPDLSERVSSVEKRHDERERETRDDHAQQMFPFPTKT